MTTLLTPKLDLVFKHHAFDVLESLSADKETRYRAEMRDRALKNEIFQLRVAHEEGFEEGR